MTATSPAAPSALHHELADHYLASGLRPDQFWFGPEHPALEQRAIQLLQGRPSQRVLEIGYQAGGFAIPVIDALGANPGFRYTGLDSLAYPNAVGRHHLEGFLARRGVPGDRYRFLLGDAWDYLMTSGETFDLVLVDHAKDVYPRELTALFARDVVAPGGVVLMHDVLDKAARAWAICARLCDSFGWRGSIDASVPAGLAVIDTAGGRPNWNARAQVVRAEMRYGLRRLARALRGGPGEGARA